MKTEELEAQVNREIESMRAVSAETARALLRKLKEYENTMRSAGMRYE